MTDDRLGLPSCSSLARLEKCPYSLVYDREKQETYTSDLAQKGTRIHAYLEGAPIVLSEGEREIAESCKIVAKNVIDEWAQGEGTQELIKEERVFYEKDGKKLFSGKPDLAIAKRDEKLNGHVLILDYKTGPTEYEEASVNLQLRGLAVATRNYIKREFDEDIETISCAIIQPLVTWRPQVVTYSKEYLDIAEGEIVGICTAPREEPRPNRYCHFCNGFVVCKGCQEATQQIAITRKNVFDLVVNKTPKERRELYNTACLAMKTADAIIRACREAMENGAHIPGLQLKEGKKVRSMSIDGVNLIASRILPKSALDRCMNVKVTQLYNEFYKMKNMTGRVNHKECKEMFENLFDDYITVKQCDNTIQVKSNE